MEMPIKLLVALFWVFATIIATIFTVFFAPFIWLHVKYTAYKALGRNAPFAKRQDFAELVIVGLFALLIFTAFFILP